MFIVFAPTEILPMDVCISFFQVIPQCLGFYPPNDHGHRQRGRCIQHVGHSDSVNLGESGASSIFTWVKDDLASFALPAQSGIWKERLTLWLWSCVTRKILAQCSLRTSQSHLSLFLHVRLHVLCNLGTSFPIPNSSDYYESISKAKWTVFSFLCACSIAPFSLFILYYRYAGKLLNLSNPSVNIGFCIQFFHYMGDSNGVVREIVSSQRIMLAGGNMVFMTLITAFLDAAPLWFMSFVSTHIKPSYEFCCRMELLPASVHRIDFRRLESCASWASLRLAWHWFHLRFQCSSRARDTFLEFHIFWINMINSFRSSAIVELRPFFSPLLFLNCCW